mmetsp:Transcript_113465/g.315984  ORF Transcript_113465/g.315984 Transcript_113465/m.315984 type:complete len:426 (+) Transcript_113465:57-1334(+)
MFPDYSVAMFDVEVQLELPADELPKRDQPSPPSTRKPETVVGSAGTAVQAAHATQSQFTDYAHRTLKRLEDPTVGTGVKQYSDAEFTAAVLPQVLSNLRGLSSGAPLALKGALAKILTEEQLLPHQPVGLDPRKRHLSSYPENAGVPEAKPRLIKALEQLIKHLPELEKGGDDAEALGLSCPVRISLVNLAGEEVGRLALEAGSSASALRRTAASLLDCPADTLAFIHEDREMLNSDPVVAKGEGCAKVTVVRGAGSSLAGVYAAYSCDILVLYEDGQAAAAWYDDYWQDTEAAEAWDGDCSQSGRGEECIIGRPIRDFVRGSGIAAQWTSARDPYAYKGSWTVSGADSGPWRVVSGNAYEPYLDNSQTFELSVKHDRVFSEGISDVVLEGVRYNAFRGKSDEQKPEKVRFYLVADLLTDPPDRA